MIQTDENKKTPGEENASGIDITLTVKHQLSHVSNTQNENEEDQILSYSKDAFTHWVKSNGKDTELAQFSLFLQITNNGSDLMADQDEILKLVEVVQKMQHGSDKHFEEMSDQAKKLFATYQDSNYLSFRSFQKLLDQMEWWQPAEDIDQQMYKNYFKTNCCTSCLGRCCLKWFRKVRMKQTANRLMKFVEIEKKMTPTKPADIFLLTIQAVHVGSGMGQIFDFYSDVFVTWVIYEASFKTQNKASENDYQFALIVCFISLAATLMATQSCVIGMKFSQGDFEPQNFTKVKCFYKFLNFLLLTFIGAALLLPIELLDNLSKLFKFFGLMFRGTKGVEMVDIFFIRIKKKLTGLNAYQLQSIEDQRKVFALLFENLPFTLLLISIEFSLLDCKELLEGKAQWTIIISLASTLLQVLLTIMMTYVESKWLNESTLSYLMTKMTANNNWIPYIHTITCRGCQQNINFGDLAIKIPFISHAFGFQQMILFEFSDNSLIYLLNELKLWSSENNGLPQKKRYRFIFSKNCLNHVSINTFVHFVQNFPEDLFILEIQLDWKQFYQEQKQKDRIQYTFEKGQKRCYSPAGEPLILLCIKNELNPYKWHLEEMLKIILESKDYSAYDSVNGSPMTIAIEYKCYKSFDILSSGEYDFDFQAQDTNGLSLLGYVIQQVMNFPDQSSQEYRDILRITKDVISKIEIDMHRDQFANTGTVKKLISGWQWIFKNIRHSRVIKDMTRIILEKAEKMEEFQLNDKEKYTLMKSAQKLFITLDYGQNPAWQKLCEIMLKCDGNIFEWKDKNNYGIEHLLTKDWPLAFKSADVMNGQLKYAYTKELKEKWDIKSDENRQAGYLGFYYNQYNSNKGKGTELIFENIVKSDLVTKVLESPISQLLTIFEIDEISGLKIKNLDDAENPLLYKQVVTLMVDTFQTNKKLFKSLHQQIMRRVNDPKLFVKIIKWALKHGVNRLDSIFDVKKDSNVQPIQNLKHLFADGDEDQDGAEIELKEELQNQEDQYENLREFDDGKLTRRLLGNGNLKRNVCNEEQKDPEVFKLTQRQRQLVGMTSDPKTIERQKKIGNAMRGLLETILEWIAGADIFTDMIVLNQLLSTNQHRAWSTVTIFSLIAPFFACQTPFLMFLKEKLHRDKKQKLYLRIMGYIMVSPIMLIYMFILDIIFVFNQALVFPIISLLKVISFGILDLTCLSDGLDRSYEYLFQMQRLEAAGFRRMRTISQLTFETLIQIILQVRMLIYFRSRKDSISEEEMGVSLDSIGLSFLISISHALLEMIFIYTEAQASRTTFVNYTIVCFNGRFGWVPYNDYLILYSQQTKEEDKQSSLKKTKVDVVNHIELDFQNIQSRVMCLNMHIEFQFTDDTLLSLSKTLAAFPIRLNGKNMPVVRFGSTIDRVKLENLENLLRVCQDKVEIDLSGTNLEAIFQQSKHADLLTQQNASQLSQEDLNYLFDLQNLRIYQLLSFVLKTNDQNLKATKYCEVLKKDVTFADITLRDQDTELLEVLLCLESEVFNEQMREVEDRNTLSMRLLNTNNFDIWVVLSSNSALFNSFQDMVVFRSIVTMEKRNPDLFWGSMLYYHTRFGPSMPKEIINDVMQYESVYNIMGDSKKLYPQTIYVRNGLDYVSVECRTAFKFAAIRKLLIKAWEIKSNGPSIDPEESDGTYNKPLDISKLGVPLADFKLLNMILSDKEYKEVKNLTAEKVNELDKWVFKLKLDTHKYIYIGRTRVGDNTGHQIEALFYGKDLLCDEYGHSKYEIEAGFNRTLNPSSHDRHFYYDSFEMQTPKEMSFITYHRMFCHDALDSAFSAFFYQKEHAYKGHLAGTSGGDTWSELEGDAVQLAQFSESQRFAIMKSAKPFYCIESIKPAIKIKYTGHDRGGTRRVNDFRVLLKFDFPYGIDLDAQQEFLENQTQNLRQIVKDECLKKLDKDYTLEKRESNDEVYIKAKEKVLDRFKQNGKYSNQSDLRHDDNDEYNYDVQMEKIMARFNNFNQILAQQNEGKDDEKDKQDQDKKDDAKDKDEAQEDQKEAEKEPQKDEEKKSEDEQQKDQEHEKIKAETNDNEQQNKEDKDEKCKFEEEKPKNEDEIQKKIEENVNIDDQKKEETMEQGQIEQDKKNIDNEKQMSDDQIIEGKNKQQEVDIQQSNNQDEVNKAQEMHEQSKNEKKESEEEQQKATNDLQNEKVEVTKPDEILNQASDDKNTYKKDEQQVITKEDEVKNEQDKTGKTNDQNVKDQDQIEMKQADTDQKKDEEKLVDE